MDTGAGERIRATFEKHRGEPGVSLDQYVRRHRIELGKALDGKIAIYLDTRYWIVIRDVVIGRRGDSESASLLAELRRLVAGHRAFCPISEVLLLELFKQTDLGTRQQTARLIDELSLGVSLAAEEERVGTELAHFIYTIRKPDSVYKREWLVWLKLAYAATMAHPTNTGLATAEELALQKAHFDGIWAMTLEEFVDELVVSEPPPLAANFTALAERLNRENELHSQELRSFKQVYTAEVFGVLNVFAKQALEIFAHVYAGETGKPTNWSEAERREGERVLQRMLGNAMRLGKLHTQLPTLHVIAMCHSAHRWDKKRRFEANDFLDFHHAAAALAYCDIFLTENDLRTLVTAEHMRLDKELACVTISDTAKAVEHLRSL